MRLAAAALLFLVAICALSTASARRGLAPPSLRLRVSRPPPLAHPAPLAVAAKPRSAPVTAAARRVCAGALVAASLLLGLSTPSSAASDPSTTRSPPASVTPSLPPRLSYWDFGGRLQRLEDTAFTKEDAREMEAERKEEEKAKEAERKAEMKVMADTMQTNFVISTLLTASSLVFSLAVNEDFMAKVFPPQ